MDLHELTQRCAALLAGNQVQSGAFRYTRPAPETYEHQWLWDSCFHAITYRWFDPQMAQDELWSLVQHQFTAGDDAGLIPHMTYWQGDGTRLWARPDRSTITQPPLIGIAALLVYEKTADRDFLASLYPYLVRYHEWFDRRRDPDGDDLVSIIHPWESGWDASPRWDAPMHLHHPSVHETHAARDAHMQILHAYGHDAQKLAADGYFCVESVEFNAIRVADLQALARIAAILNQPAGVWTSRAAAITAAIQQKFITPGGIFDLSGPDETPIQVPSSAPFILLFGACIDPATAAALVQQMKSDRFWPTYPVPTTPTDHPAFVGDHYWRGNVWMSVNWLIYTGLRTMGYTAAARELAYRSLDLVEQHGFYEYFNPITGHGNGPAQQSWTAVVLDMIATAQ